MVAQRYYSMAQPVKSSGSKTTELWHLSVNEPDIAAHQQERNDLEIPSSDIYWRLALLDVMSIALFNPQTICTRLLHLFGPSNNFII